MKAAVYTSSSGLTHDMGEGHPECPARLQALLSLFEEEFPDLPVFESDAAEEKQIALAHDPGYIRLLEKLSPAKDMRFLDGDTAMTPFTLEAAYKAAGAGVQAVDDAAGGACERAFCAVRPPGHHAEPDRAMGFCFFNNVVIAARYAQDKHGLATVGILDFDVHHGNGTQTMAKRHEGICFVSSHQMPLFPGSGSVQDNDEPKVLNAPIKAGSGSDEMRGLYREALFPHMKSCRPDLLLVSAGFDAHGDDPLAGLTWSADDYHWLGAEINRLAADLRIPVIAFLEGGYNLGALRQSVREFWKGLAYSGA